MADTTHSTALRKSWTLLVCWVSGYRYASLTLAPGQKSFSL